jgi:hypothetical protein
MCELTKETKFTIATNEALTHLIYLICQRLDWMLPKPKDKELRKEIVEAIAEVTSRRADELGLLIDHDAENVVIELPGFVLADQTIRR